MLTYEEIINYTSNYKVENGIVIDKINNQQIKDESIILKVKSSILIYLNANNIHKDDIHLNGRETKTKEQCILKSMEQYSVNNEKTNIGINKVINELLKSDGHYEADMSGNNLDEGKYAMFSEQKRDLGIAYLRLRFRENNFDISDFKINLQEIKSQTGKSTGQYRITIDFKKSKYDKKTPLKPEEKQTFHHPKSNELNELEQLKQIAKQNNDEDAYKYAQSNIERILKENQASLNQEQWNFMTTSEKISFVQFKMKESKVMNDHDSFNYWNANLQSLKEKQAYEMIQAMANGQLDTNGQPIIQNQEQISNGRQMGFVKVWILVFITTVISLGIIILGMMSTI